jgi:hypothetical protein
VCRRLADTAARQRPEVTENCGTQVAGSVAIIMAFMNNRGLFDEDYRRFVASRLRESPSMHLLARPRTSHEPPKE